MPRGRKKKPTDINEQIALVQAAIEQISAELKEKKKLLTDLETQKKIKEQDELLVAIANSGKSTDEILALLNGTQEQEETPEQEETSAQE